MIHWIEFRVKISEQFNGANDAFLAQTGMRLSQYLLDFGYAPQQSKDLLQDRENVYYNITQVDRKFLSFVEAYKHAFGFEGENLGYVVDPTDEQLDSLVPESVQYSQGKTWREYLPSPVEVEITQELLDSATPSNVSKILTWAQYMQVYSEATEQRPAEIDYLGVGVHKFYQMRSFYVTNSDGSKSRPTLTNDTEFWAIKNIFEKVWLDYEVEALKQ